MIKSWDIKKMNRHEKYMALAIKLARRAEGMTSPNPLVGAVIVKKSRIVGKGYHRKAGLPHAEINALRDAGEKARGATIYVTLEPCDHFGRTPPCTGALIRSGIKNVVVGMKDPNPANNGRGIKKLRGAGIDVATGVLQKECLAMNSPYIKAITKKIPYVTLKLAETIDGKISSPSGDSKWITGEDSRRYVQRLRSRVDAVMVGANTASKDDPLLLSRIKGSKQPMRVIVAGRRQIPQRLKMFQTNNVSDVIIAHPGKGRIKAYPYAQFLPCRSKNGRVDLRDLLKKLALRGVTHILAEGGGELAWGLIKERLVDKFLFFIAPKIMGGRSSVTSVEGKGVFRARDAFNLKDITVRRFKKDILIEAERL